MTRLCERPGCSRPGAVAYGMVAEELVFWIEPIGPGNARAGVLCERHADAMVVPRAWTLDDRRDPSGPRLFQPQRFEQPVEHPAERPRPRARHVDTGAQLQIDGTSEVPRRVIPAELEARLDAELSEPEAEPGTMPDPVWAARFDLDDDIGGLLNARSPLLARAFGGPTRQKER